MDRNTLITIVAAIAGVCNMGVAVFYPHLIKPHRRPLFVVVALVMLGLAFAFGSGLARFDLK